jgi:hypothetical protein
MVTAVIAGGLNRIVFGTHMRRQGVVGVGEILAE